MQYLLASDGIPVRAFDKPEEFWPTPPHPVSVVVTDIWMEGVTGLEILARMCAISPRPRVIVITARDDWPRAPPPWPSARWHFSSSRSTTNNFSRRFDKRWTRRELFKPNQCDERGVNRVYPQRFPRTRYFPKFKLTTSIRRESLMSRLPTGLSRSSNGRNIFSKRLGIATQICQGDRFSNQSATHYRNGPTPGFRQGTG